MKLAAAQRHGDLYPDRHLNVFVPYQAHDLDYNVTRAVITTLRWSRPELTQAFLKDVAGVGAPASGYQFDLQSCDYEDFDSARVETQILLGISVAGRLATKLPPLDDADRRALLLSVLRAPVPYGRKLVEVQRILARTDLDADDLAVLHHSLEELEDGCMPDGWVFNPEAGVCLLMEAKLTNLLDLYQIQRYGDLYFERSFKAEEIVLKSWEEIASFFAAHTGDPDPRTSFLCKQLCDYLDLLGLGPFSGFRPYDFDSDAAQEALPKFRRFIEHLGNQAREQGLPLAEVRPSPTGARVAFSDPDLPGELRIDLCSGGIRVEHRSGDSSQGNHAGRASIDRILEASGDGEINPLAGLELPDLSVRIERMRSHDPYGEAFVELETLSSVLDPEQFDFALTELRRQHPPAEDARGIAGHYRRAALSLGSTIARDDALGGAQAVTEKALSTIRVLLQAARKLIANGEASPPKRAS